MSNRKRERPRSDEQLGRNDRSSDARLTNVTTGKDQRTTRKANVLPRPKPKPKRTLQRSRREKLHEIGGGMPPLYHKLPGLPLSYDRSEVIQWIASNPAALRYLFANLIACEALVYDSEAGKWKGGDA